MKAWQYRQWYGDGIGGTCFVVVRDNPNFPKLPAKDKYPSGGIGDEVMRGVSGMGPQRHSADASKPEASIKQLEADIAIDRELYLPFDPSSQARADDRLQQRHQGTSGRRQTDCRTLQE